MHDNPTGAPEPAPATKGAQTRRAVLDAAITRFGREGYRATSVADIARDAGVGGTVAYAYFPNKEALFIAAADEDAAAIITEGLAAAVSEPDVSAWGKSLFTALIAALDSHPLARRLLGGLEPEVTGRVLGIPALNEIRKAFAERLGSGQLQGEVRPEIDPVTIANGVVAIVLSLLMSVVQLGEPAAELVRGDIDAVFDAAIAVRPPSPRRRADAPARPAPGPGSVPGQGPTRR